MLVFLSPPPFAGAQNLKPFTSLRVIRTERFDIVFPEESRRTALELAGMADGIYERVSGLLGIELDARVPVTITPHTDRFNAYMNPFPYPHIVLFDTPLDPEWTTFRNSLEGLFLHELVHAVSLSSRGKTEDFFHGLFGGWVIPAGFVAPLFMGEGVTVSFESLDGSGRANDPRVRQRIRQAQRDGTFLTPFQAAGAYDLPPQGNAYYEYGGLFSDWLQERRGMEKYAELWKGMGSRFPVSLNFDRHGFFRIFEQTYGMTFKKAWADFAASLALVGLEGNDARLLEGELLIEAMDSAGGRVFLLDGVASRVLEWDPATGSSRTAVQGLPLAADIDVSADGKLLLVSGYRTAGDRSIAEVEEYDTAKGRKTGRSWKSLYKARYFRDGLVGIGSDLHANRLVWRDRTGAERVLLEGSSERSYSSPAPLDGDRIAFIVAEKGDRRIGIYDFRTGTAALLETDLSDDFSRWRYARDLRASDGALYFTYDHDDRFSKLALIRLDGASDGTAVFSGRDFSGGVQAPVEAAGSLYYRGAFSTWDALMRFPEAPASLEGVHAAVRLAPWPAVSAPDASAVASASAPDASAVAVAAEPVAVARIEKRYSALPYLNPFSLWIPVPLLRTDGTAISLDGGGILSYLSDPTDMNTVMLSAGGDRAGNLGYFEIEWKNLGLGVPLTLYASDAIAFQESDGESRAYRATRFLSSLSFERGVRGEGTRAFIAPSAQAAFNAPDPQDGSGSYEWTYDEPRYAVGLDVGLSTMSKKAWRLFAEGSSLAFSARLTLPESESRLDAVARFSAQRPFGARVTAYAAWDEDGVGLDGESALFGSSSWASESAAEYAREAPSALNWVAGAEIDLLAVSIETQTNLSHLYFNRLFATVGWRGAVFDADDVSLVQSLTAKAGAVLSGIPAAMVPVRFSPYAWAALKLSNLGDDDAGNDLAVGFALSVEW